MNMLTALGAYKSLLSAKSKGGLQLKFILFYICESRTGRQYPFNPL